MTIRILSAFFGAMATLLFGIATVQFATLYDLIPSEPRWLWIWLGWLGFIFFETMEEVSLRVGQKP